MGKTNEAAVVVKDLYKSFRLPHEQHSGLKQVLLNIFRPASKRVYGYETQQVLNDVSFEIKKGEFFGIVGRNGSGKSTLLKLLAGIYVPDKGLVQVDGTLTPFIELGVGFNPELTGRENVYLNGALLGFNHEEMDDMYDDIVKFAELEKFMDQKLKNYSSGMQVRLAFSIAIRAQSDVLLIDEVLAVGDAVFQKKCFDYFKQLKHDKRTVIFVSHDREALLQYCTRGVLIDKGKLIAVDSIDSIINDYSEILNNQSIASRAPDRPRNRWGDGSASIEEVLVKGSDSKNHYLTDKDKTVDIVVKQVFNRPINNPVYGVIISDKEGRKVFISNTLQMGNEMKPVKEGQMVEAGWRIPNIFPIGTFTVSPAVANSDGTIILDWRNDIAQFESNRRINNPSLAYVDHTIDIRTKIQEA